jgi:hypothetical protein
MPASTYLVAHWEDMLASTVFTAPASCYLQMDTTIYAADGTGGVALTGTSAARQAVTWAASSSRQKANSTLITFTADAPLDWASNPPLKAWSLWDALTAGNMLWYDLLTAQLVLAQHSIVRVAAGQLLLIFD